MQKVWTCIIDSCFIGARCGACVYPTDDCQTLRPSLILSSVPTALPTSPAPRSRLHAEGAEAALPPHPLPAEVRLCGKLEVLDRILAKLHAGGHKVSRRLRARKRVGHGCE